MSAQLLLVSSITSLEITRARSIALNCTRCALSNTRNKVVFGVGCEVRPPIVFVAAAPGATEDLEGRPFTGKTGELLDKMIRAMGYDREEVYITYSVLCRPPDNRE